MNTKNIFVISFIASIIVVIAGAYLKITHGSGSDILLATGLILSLVYIIVGIYEVFSSPRIDKTEKILWAVGFVLMSGVTALLYLIIGRKRVTTDAVAY